MSTISKLDPEVRRARTMRANVLRMRVGLQSQIIMSVLRRAHDASHLTGAEKNTIFEFGARQVELLEYK